MRARRALLAVLLALFAALSPLLGDITADCAATRAQRAAADWLGMQPPATTRAETRAVLPQPVALPSMQEHAVASDALPLTIACVRHPQHSLWVAVCMDTLRIPCHVAQGFMDHPHHAPPSLA